MNTNPLIIDVDTGVDDAVAIAFAIAKGATILGVSTVAGNVPIEVATRNTLDVLTYLGRADIPVHRGASRPLAATYQDAIDVHGGNGLGGMELTQGSTAEEPLPGPAFILQSAERFAGELDLVMLGPLTNLAIALNVRPELVRQIRRVVVMGGAYFVAGNKGPHAEFNVYVDPDAADQVFDANWNDITLVGLDVTHQTVVSREQWANIPNDATGASGLVRGVMGRTFNDRIKSGFYLHDPLAVAVALEPDLVRGAHYAVNVQTAGELRGKTTPGRGGRGPLVATAVDADRFVNHLSRVLGLPEVEATGGLENAE